MSKVKSSSWFLFLFSIGILSIISFLRSPQDSLHFPPIVVEFDSPVVLLLESFGWVLKREDSSLQWNIEHFSIVINYCGEVLSHPDLVTIILNRALCSSIDPLSILKVFIYSRASPGAS